MTAINFQRLKFESGWALMMETGGVRGHICSWGWLTPLARLSHGLCELSWKSKVPKSMRTNVRQHPQRISSILVSFQPFVCLCVRIYTYCNTPVKGLSFILWVSVGGLLKSPTFTVSFWGFLSFWWFRYDLHKPASLNETSVQSRAPSGASGPHVWEWVRENLHVCNC